MSSRLAAIISIAASGISACATIPEHVADTSRLGPVAELSSTPFYPQERYQCGPAALSTVLAHSGVDVSLDTLTELTYIPQRQGSLQTELLSTARSYERIPYRIDGSMQALASELLAGRPVLVLQNLGVRWYPKWHYAVVVGFDTETNSVILRSGIDRRRSTKKKTFLHTWRRGDYWGIVLLRPGELPVNPDKDRVLKAVADVEALGHHRAAMLAWTASLREWPDEPVALFGKANSAYYLGDFTAAEASYRALLIQDPQLHAARNNLAFALAENGKLAEAMREMQSVLDSIDDDDPLRSEYESSLRELAAR